nr:MAG TPA: hypothetical protein [Caudoviricetes sp.]
MDIFFATFHGIFDALSLLKTIVIMSHQPTALGVLSPYISKKQAMLILINFKLDIPSFSMSYNDSFQQCTKWHLFTSVSLAKIKSSVMNTYRVYKSDKETLNSILIDFHQSMAILFV